MKAPLSKFAFTKTAPMTDVMNLKVPVKKKKHGAAPSAKIANKIKSISMPKIKMKGM